MKDQTPFNPEHSPSAVLGQEGSVSKMNSTLLKLWRVSRGQMFTIDIHF